MSNDSQIGVSFTANTSGLTDGLNAASNGVKSAVNDMSSQFSGLASTVENLKAPFLALTAILGGGALFKDAIQETIGLTLETEKLARQLGVSTEEASGLREALEKLGIDSDTYGAAVFKLQIALRTQEGELNKNGIATRDAKGGHLAIQEVMMNGIDRLKEMNKGYDANALSMLMWGRGAKEMQDLQRLTNERIAEGDEETKKLGTSITGGMVAAMRAYKEAMVDVSDVFDAIKVQVGSQLLPSLTALGKWFSDTGPAIIGPVVGIFKTLLDLLDSTAVKAALLTIVLKATLSGAFWAVASAVSTAVGFMKSWIVLMNIQGVTGFITGLNMLKTATMGLIGPWTLVALAIGAAFYGLEQWATASTRAAQSQKDVADKAQNSATEFANLESKARSLDATIKSSKSTDDQKAKAQAQLKIVLGQLNALYPDFNKFLLDEKGHQRDIGTALALANKEREKEMKLKLEMAELSLTNARIDASSSAKLLNSNVVTRNSGILKTAAESDKKAVELMSAAVDHYKAALASIQGDVPKKTGQKFKDKEKETPTNELWDKEFNELRIKGETRQAWATTDEMAFWKKKLDAGKGGADALLVAQDRYNQAAKKFDKENTDAAQKASDDQDAIDKNALQIALTKAKQDSAGRLAVAEAYRAKMKEEHGATSKQYMEADKIVEVEAERHSERMLQINAIAAQTRENALMHLLDLEEQITNQIDDKEGASDRTRLKQQIDFEEKRYQVALTAAKERAKAETDPVRQAQAYQQIEQLTQQHNLKMQAMNDNLGNLTAMKFKEVFAGITSGFASSIAGLIKGTMSWADALNNVLDQALDWVIDFFVQWGLEAAANYLALQIFGATSRATEATGAAAVYAINAASSVAAIPMIGWAMAPGVMAAAYGAGLGMAGLASAAGGWGEVPNDQIAQIHKKEMILPAQLADGIRGMIAGGGPQGGGGDTFIVHANDAKSFMDMYKRSTPDVLKHHKEMIRLGRATK